MASRVPAEKDGKSDLYIKNTLRKTISEWAKFCCGQWTVFVLCGQWTVSLYIGMIHE